jgi:phthiocerol/phenolphthiocerol synthesis type-I polyketide synthase E
MTSDSVTELGTEIAIVAAAGRFPGANDVDRLWQNVRDGVESVVPLSDDELLAGGAPASQLARSEYVKLASYLDGVEQFDAGHFGYTAREATITDPQQRAFLEVAWEALERAGYDSLTYPGRIGVYAGAGASTYLLNMFSSRDIRESVDSFQALLANDKDYLATRVSYKLNLRGPSLSVQTACSTSLVAVHLACQSLLAYQCDMALAGGVSINVWQKAGYLYQEGMIFSPDGHCRPFDAEAGGTIGGSGAGIVVLKRLGDALADGDRVLAIIRGSAINNDGAQKVGFTAPSVDGQADVIAEALAVAGVDPGSVSYVEAHGTATPLGDPIEVAALRQAYGDDGIACGIGSLKANIGHLDAAAGVAGLIKTTLALHHGVLPPSLNYQRPNPKIDFGPRFAVNAQVRPWVPGGASGDAPRRAGVSSFGIGGTNAHVVLEEAPLVPAGDPAVRPHAVLMLAARTPSALEAATDRLAQHLGAHPELALADVAFTLQVGRRHFSHRRAIVATSLADVADALAARAPSRLLGGVAERERPVAFLFPGQGAQAPQMARGLYETEPVFRAALDACAEGLLPTLGLDLREVLFPSADVDPATAEARLRQTALAQPALFSVGYALATWLTHRGVRPSALLGHSVGEYVAATVAGVFTLEDAFTLVAARGRLMQSLPPGAMLAVPLAESDVLPLLGADLLGRDLDLAAVNGPQHCVVAGSDAAIDALRSQLDGRGIEAKRLRTSHAFHSAMMAPILDAFRTLVAGVPLQPPTLPVVSNVTGSWLTPAQATDPAYWAAHLRGTVRFADGLATLLADDHALLEVGPGRALTTFARAQAGAGAAAVTTLGGPETDDTSRLEGAIARLWLLGAPIDWSAAYADERRLRVDLPTYPFERRRYWVERPPTAYSGLSGFANVMTNDESVHPDEAPRLHQLHPRPNLATPFVAPTNEIEESIARIWHDLLGIDEVGIYDNFLELGGHSLLGTQLTSRLRDAFAVSLSVRTVFEAETIAELAEVVELALIEQIDALSEAEAAVPVG